MVRPLRIDIPDGWYHITNRGIDRQAIFGDDHDRNHFLEVLAELPVRFMVRVHAYVLMTNHYHLLIQTPDANASRAIQWLNVSYSIWYNRRHDRVGPLFQGRFKSMLIDGNGAWAWEASVYIHLNPVRLQRLGADRAARQASRDGRGGEVESKTLRKRGLELRGYPWSSYRAYVGEDATPPWLTTRVILDRVGRNATAGEKAEKYRTSVEGMIGVEDKDERRTEWRQDVVQGGAAFIERMRKMARGDRREQPALKFARRRVAWEEVVGVVARERGEKWESFCDRHGDDGRDMALVIGRRLCGMSLRELGERAGGMGYASVSEAIRRMERRIKEETSLRRQIHELVEILNIET